MPIAAIGQGLDEEVFCPGLAVGIQNANRCWLAFFALSTIDIS